MPFTPTPPVRAGAQAERALVLALTATVTVLPLAPASLARIALAALGTATLAAMRWRAPAATSVGLLGLACALLAAIGVGPSQVVLPVALAIHGCLVRAVPWLRAEAGWLTRGALSPPLVAAILGIAVVSGAALLGWHRALHPDVADLVRDFVPDWPLGALVLGASAFALWNAAIEEAVYRGVLQGALVRVLPPAPAIALQALAFGAIHLHGFPRGAVGVALASVYGAMLGALRHRGRGLLAPWLAHVATDLVIASLLIRLARG
ncbi:MAG: CPBP family intramembrane glutamic endopeptidase [bacterium]